jgi:hypothetical protein
MANSSPLTRRERLRRVTLLCCHFMRNLAYYRVSHPGEPRSPNRDFWVTVDGNFLDQCVLEWCKLLADERAQHHWMAVTSGADRFKNELLACLRLDATAFQDYRNEMREYRDKFVAHLDQLRVMQVPRLETAKASVEFYHAYVVDNEAQAGDLYGLPNTAALLREYYDRCTAEAERVYRHIDGSLPPHAE